MGYVSARQRKARAADWCEASGLDISASIGQYVHEHHGLSIDIGPQKGRYETADFDCVHVKDVKEHFRDPLSELRECARIVKPNGVLVVETLNIDSVFARIMGKRYRGFLPGHVALFGPRSLSLAVTKAGFDVVRTYAGEEIPMRLYLSVLPLRQAVNRTLKKVRWGRVYLGQHGDLCPEASGGTESALRA